MRKVIPRLTCKIQGSHANFKVNMKMVQRQNFKVDMQILNLNSNFKVDMQISRLTCEFQVCHPNCNFRSAVKGSLKKKQFIEVNMRKVTPRLACEIQGSHANFKVHMQISRLTWKFQGPKAKFQGCHANLKVNMQISKLTCKFQSWHANFKVHMQISRFTCKFQS